MSDDRLPWEVIETFPSSDPELIAHWDASVQRSEGAHDRVRSLVGRALSLYWAVQEKAVEEDPDTVALRRRDDVDDAQRIALAVGDLDLVATTLLAELYTRWGPDTLAERHLRVEQLGELHGSVTDPELQLRIREWQVLVEFDHGRLAAASKLIEEFASASEASGLVLFRRREELWRANLAMLRGQIDLAVSINQEAISSTATLAGSPFSFQNVAITLAIERFFRRGLADTIETIRSVRASSPRVATNWDTGLAFALAETGQLDEAAQIFDRLGADDFSAIHRDLNWLVTMQLLGLVARRLDDHGRCALVLEQLAPFAHLDATHGSGYASYGPVGRVVGALAARCGDMATAQASFDHVLTTREPGPWTALTQLDLALAHSASDPRRALDKSDTAVAALTGAGLTEWVQVAAALRRQLRTEGYTGPVARLVDGHWALLHARGRATVPAGKGASQLMTLLERPGEPIDVLALDGTDERKVGTGATSERSLDETARRAYRTRLRDLDASAREGARADDLATEREFLARELAASRFAPSSSPEVERARVRVTKAIRRVIAVVDEQSPALGAVLRGSLHTGRRCLYSPEDGQAWRIVAGGSSGDAPP